MSNMNRKKTTGVSLITNEKDLGGLLFLVSGPSGVGKGSVIQALKNRFPSFVFPISATTRPARPGEKDGEVYHFLSKDEFEQKIDRNEFLEYAFIHQQYYYGTLRKPIIDALRNRLIVIREVDIQGFHTLRRLIPKKNLRSIFIKAESFEELIQRITKRSALPAQELEHRMESARVEMKDASHFDYQVKNLEGKLEQCIADVAAIIQKEAQKAGLKI